MALYKYDERIKNLDREIANSGLRCTNKTVLRDFCNRLFADGLSIPRVHKYYWEMFQLAKMVPNKLLLKMTKDDVVELVASIEKNQRWAPATKQGYKICIKKFYSIMELDKSHIDWFKTTLKRKDRTLPSPADMLTEDDVMKMIDVNERPLNRALIASFWDAGGRIGEIGNWKIGDISTFKYGLKVKGSGKTGSRQIPLIVAAPYITQWLAVHPKKDDPNAYVWYSRNTGENLSYSGIYKILGKSAEKAGINKRFNPQTYRHSRATDLANTMTESQMDEYLGWVQGSNMPSTYIHLSGKNIDHAALKAAGIDIVEDKHERHKMKPKKCPRCQQAVGATFNLCPYCGYSLTIEQAMSEDEMEMSADDELAKLLATNPQLRELLKIAMDKL